MAPPFQFHVMTEKDVPQGVEGWWAKLALFQPGRFDGRCLYLDLDTLIVGPISDLRMYQGPFAGLSDFYHPHRLQSAVMLWEAGEADRIWESWEAAGRPQYHPGGDGWWIDTMMPEARRLQDLFPKRLVSFKAHCANGVPEGASVVCFHGLPRPHALADLMSHW